MADKKGNTGKENTGENNSGDWNSGYRNSGDWNSGYRNSGDWNSGYRNSGDWNSGDGNSGDGNSGDWNSGDGNSGDGNSGDWNSGYRNSGYRNSGYGNQCNRETGLFNTIEGTIRCFNKDSGKKYEEIDHPSYYRFDLCKWITEQEMTEQEKIDEPEFHVRGGYLKQYEYKEAWANFWKDTKEDNKKKFLALPNFDAEIFKEITGIDIEQKKEEKMIKLSNGKKVSESTVMEALKALTE